MAPASKRWAGHRRASRPCRVATKRMSRSFRFRHHLQAIPSYTQARSRRRSTRRLSCRLSGPYSWSGPWWSLRRFQSDWYPCRLPRNRTTKFRLSARDPEVCSPMSRFVRFRRVQYPRTQGNPSIFQSEPNPRPVLLDRFHGAPFGGHAALSLPRSSGTGRKRPSSVVDRGLVV